MNPRYLTLLIVMLSGCESLNSTSVVAESASDAGFSDAPLDGGECSRCTLAANATEMGCSGTACFVRACVAGYEATSTACYDINECRNSNGGCDVNATCSNTPGSRTCGCNNGFAGDGLRCVPGTLSDWQLQTFLKRDGFNDWDEFGTSVSMSADGNVVAVGAPYARDTSQVRQNRSSGGVYVFQRAYGSWSGYYLRNPDDQASAFGHSVAVSGDGRVIAIGAPRSTTLYDDGGSVYFHPTGYWGVAAIHHSRNDSLRLGSAVAISADGGTVAAADDHGNVSIFRTDSAGYWSDHRRIATPSDLPGFDASIALSGAGDLLVLGSGRYNRYGGTVWTHPLVSSGRWSAAATGPIGFATSVSLSQDGRTLAVSTPGENVGIFSVAPGGALTRNATIENPSYDSSFARRISLSGDATTLAVGSPGMRVTFPNGTQAWGAGGVYMFTRSNDGWNQSGLLRANNARTNNQFGALVAISGDGRTVVGAHPRTGGIGVGPQNRTGAAYVFAQSDSVWSQQAFLNRDVGTQYRNQYGYSLAMSDDGLTLAVSALNESRASTGSRGSIYIYTRDRRAAPWVFSSLVSASNAGQGDAFGASLALSADGLTLAVGAPGEDSTLPLPDRSGRVTSINFLSNNNGNSIGAAYVFTRPEGSSLWTQEAFVKAANGQDNDDFGRAVTLSEDGNTLAVGAPGEDSARVNQPGNNAASNSGAVYVFSRADGTWSPNAYLKASNVGANDAFGTSLSLSGAGHDLVIGAPAEDGTGAAYYFERLSSDTPWSESRRLRALNPEQGARFGAVVTISGDDSTIAVGATGEASSVAGIGGTPNGGAPNSGAVYVFSVSNWSQVYIKASNPGAQDQFGMAISLSRDGNILAIGAEGEDSNSSESPANNDAVDSGAVYSFVRRSGVWSQVSLNKAGDAGDLFGTALDMSGDGTTLAISAEGEDSSLIGLTSVPNENATDSGAVYLYAPVYQAIE